MATKKTSVPLSLEQLREAAANAAARTYGAVKAYAGVLNATPGFGPEWFNEKKPVGAVELERIAYTDLLKNKGHANPWESWRQIKLAAKKLALEAAAEAAKAEGTDEAAEGTDEAAAAGDAEKLSSWLLERLAGMIKKIEKAEAVNFSALMVLADLKNAQARVSAQITGVSTIQQNLHDKKAA
jgi:hypothetical protein